MKPSLILCPALVLGLLGGCGGNGSSPPGESTAAITGQIQGWKQGQATGVVARINTSQTIVAMGTLDTSGRFSLSLPGASVVAPFLTDGSMSTGAGCTGGYQVSVPMPRAGALYLSAVSSNNEESSLWLISGMYAQEGSINASWGLYLYADEDYTAQGQETCGGSIRRTNLTMKQGWNTVVDTRSGTTSGNCYRSRYLMLKRPDWLMCLCGGAPGRRPCQGRGKSQA